MPSTNVTPTIPIADEVRGVFISEEPVTSSFSTESKLVLNRVYGALLDANATLSGGAEVNSTARVFEWLLEQVAAAE